MATSPCPYCYQSVDLGDYKFMCSGPSKPGRNSCKEIDPQDPKVNGTPRSKLTGYMTPERPCYVSHRATFTRKLSGCPNCGSNPQIRVCTHCDTPLDSDFFSGRSPLIGLVGAKYSGKSVYVGVLHRYLREVVAPRFRSSIVFGAESSGSRQVEGNSNGMYRKGGELPLPTSEQAGRRDGRQPYVMRWVRAGAGKKLVSVMLSFYDSAGEDLRNAKSASDQAYLGAAEGLVVLIDPFQLPGNRDTARTKFGYLDDVDAVVEHDAIRTLSVITDYLRAAHDTKSTERVKVPLAVAFTKFDAFYNTLPASHPLRQTPPDGPYYYEDDGLSMHEHVKALLEQWGGSEITRYLELNYESFRLFGVSALGAEPDYATNAVNPQGVRPFRVADPILWLLAHQGFLYTMRETA